MCECMDVDVRRGRTPQCPLQLHQKSDAVTRWGNYCLLRFSDVLLNDECWLDTIDCYPLTLPFNQQIKVLVAAMEYFVRSLVRSLERFLDHVNPYKHVPTILEIALDENFRFCVVSWIRRLEVVEHSMQLFCVVATIQFRLWGVKELTWNSKLLSVDELSYRTVEILLESRSNTEQYQWESVSPVLSVRTHQSGLERSVKTFY